MENMTIETFIEKLQTDLIMMKEDYARRRMIEGESGWPVERSYKSWCYNLAAWHRLQFEV